MDGIEIPRCHYCQRLAPEIHYEGERATIHVCTKCLDGMHTAWYAYRRGDGIAIVSSEPPDKLPEWEHLETGSFSALWSHYYMEPGE